MTRNYTGVYFKLLEFYVFYATQNISVVTGIKNYVWTMQENALQQK